MEIKDIAVKIVAGEDVVELTKDFDEQKNKELDIAVVSHAKVVKQQEIDAITALRKEKTRVGDAALEAAGAKFTEKFRGEQIKKAFSKAEALLKEKGIILTPEQKTKLEEDFKTEDTGNLDAELIVPDVLKAYAKSNATSLIDDHARVLSSQADAAAFNAGGAGGNDPGAGGDPGKTYPPEVHAMVKESVRQGKPMTLERAARGMKGGVRKF